jgi:hypothetical protein
MINGPHLDEVRVYELPESVPGCEDCLAIAGKARAGKTWCWCFLDEVAFILPEVRGTTTFLPPRWIP